MDPTASLHRHQPQRPARGRRRSLNHAVRADAKRLAQSHDLCERLGLPSTSTATADGLRPLLETDLRRRYALSRPPPRLRCRTRAAALDADADEGRHLAISDVPLPSDRFRRVRLEREDAFRDASTSRGARVRLRPAVPADAADAAQVAELYRDGLLYDDDDVFDLNSIRHEQPVYSVRTARKAPKSRRPDPGCDRPLHLDLSFSDLGDDTAIAQFLEPPCRAPLTTPGDDAPRPHQHPSREAFPPLRVIYELAGSRPPFDPPDLISDLLSDYDCFSDSELDDETPSYPEAHDAANGLPSDDAWVVLGGDP